MGGRWCAWLAVAALGLAGAAPVRAGGMRDFGMYNGGRLAPSETRAVQGEQRGAWKEIHWRRSADRAVRDARAQDKPIFVFLIVGQHGQPDAPHC